MDMNKLTEKAQAAIAAAQRDAEQRHNIQLEPEHLLSALVKQAAGVVPAVLEKLVVSPSQVIVTVSPPVSPSVVAAILMIQNPRVTAGTLLIDEWLFTIKPFASSFLANTGTNGSHGCCR